MHKACEKSETTRRRKRRLHHAGAHEIDQPKPPASTTSQLEKKLDDIVSLLRAQTQGSNDNDSPLSTPSVPTSNSDVLSSTPLVYPELVVDTHQSIVRLTRAVGDNPATATLTIIHQDVAVHRHQVSDSMAEECLQNFRQNFLQVFPFVYIPQSMDAAQLYQQRPFLWLNIVTFASKNVSQQFTMEETIWQIISQRVVAQHLADIDLLLGVICFGAWYFSYSHPTSVWIPEIINALHQVALFQARQAIHDNVISVSGTTCFGTVPSRRNGLC